MKKIWKKYWPLCVLAMIAVVVLCVCLVLALRSTPVKAVEGYIRGGLEYDVDGLLRYASEYQRTVLAGNTDMELDLLRQTLENSYKGAADGAETGEIVFYSEEAEHIEKGTARFDELLDTYSYKGTPEEVDEFALVRGTYYIDGEMARTYSVAAVKCGLKWYYGFIA